MSLSRPFNTLLLQELQRLHVRMVVCRCQSTVSAALPGASRVQLSPPKEPGFFSYGRNWSRDPKFATLQSRPPQYGDTPYTFMLRRLGHAYEVYPLIFLIGFWFSIFCVATYYSFEKVEVWLDRTQTTSPTDWERLRNDYYKKATVLFDPDGRTHKRLEIMEMLQDEMLEAAKKRGTR